MRSFGIIFTVIQRPSTLYYYGAVETTELSFIGRGQNFIQNIP